MRARLRGPGGLAFGLTAAGFGWAVALIGAAFVVPVYTGGGSEVVTDVYNHTTTVHSFSSTSGTLVHENGLGILAPLAIPLLLAAVVWFALHRRCSRGSRKSGALAWSAIGVLTLFTLVASASVGFFFVPVLAFLIAAAAVTPVPAR